MQRGLSFDPDGCQGCAATRAESTRWWNDLACCRHGGSFENFQQLDANQLNAAWTLPGWRLCRRDFQQVGNKVGSLVVATIRERMVQLHRTAAMEASVWGRAIVFLTINPGEMASRTGTRNLSTGAVWLPGDGRGLPEETAQAA